MVGLDWESVDDDDFISSTTLYKNKPQQRCSIGQLELCSSPATRVE